jgi:hypothetical protein
VIRHNLVILALTAAAVVMTAFAVSPADARDNKKERQYVARQSSSLDAPATSRARAQPDTSGHSPGSPICY